MNDELKVKYEDITKIDPKIEEDDVARKMVKSMLKGTSPYEASKTAVQGTKKSPETVYQKARRLYELIMKANGESLDDLLNEFKTGKSVYIPVLRAQAFKKLLVKAHLVHVRIDKVQKFTLLDDPVLPSPDAKTGEMPFESETPGSPTDTHKPDFIGGAHPEEPETDVTGGEAPEEEHPDPGEEEPSDDSGVVDSPESTTVPEEPEKQPEEAPEEPEKEVKKAKKKAVKKTPTKKKVVKKTDKKDM